MRTTLTLDDDVLEAACDLAGGRHVPLGQAVSTLARRGLKQVSLRIAEDGFPIFDLPDDFPTITCEDVARALADFP